MLEDISNYRVVGVRWQTPDEDYSIGDICRNSYDWDYDNDVSSYDTDNPVELPGTCAIYVTNDTYDDANEIQSKINLAISEHQYVGDIVVIAGDRYDWGADEDEVIIEDPIVIAKVAQ